MTLRKTALFAAAAGAAVLGGPAAAEPKMVYFDGSNGASSEKIENQFVCVFNKDAVSKGNVRSRANQAAGPHGGRVLRDFKHSIRGFSVRMAPQAIENMMARNPNISYCEQDEIITLAPPPGKGPNKGGDGGGGGADPQTTPWGVTRVNGGATYTGSRVAWVLDSGIDLDHPDLNVNVSRSVDFTGSRKGADDENGHGTHVAGTIAAKNNDFGVVGVAAGAQVIAVRVLNRRGSGSYSGIIAGVDHVAANGSAGDVANMSLGGGVSTALNDAVRAAAATGIRFTLAAGNESTDAGTKSPASTEGNNVYTISSFAQGDRWSSFSNYGSVVDYAEPGSGIPSTYKDGGYATLSGTSMAAPHAAGILLLGNISSDGTVSGDPDGNPDPIGVR